ncbi:MAG: LacI family DNA-binding transcriptional regulator [Candidatus Sumerlaeia bacterium]
MQENEPRQGRMSLADIARELGVSRATVSLALKDHHRISETTKKRVRDLAERLGYEPSAALSAAMSEARVGGAPVYRETIACVSVYKPLDYYERAEARENTTRPMREFLVGLRERAAEVGCRLDFFSTADVPAQALIKVLQARGIRRAILVGHWADRKAIQTLYPLWDHFACVALGALEPQWVQGPLVLPDYFAAGRLTFIKAWVAGYRHIYMDKALRMFNLDRRFESGLQSLAAQLPVKVVAADLNPHPDAIKAFLDPLPLNPRECCLVTARSRAMLEAIALLPEDARPGVVDWQANLLPAGEGICGVDQRERYQARRCVDLSLAPWSPPSRCQNGAPEIYLIEPEWIEGESLRQIRRGHLDLGDEDIFPQSRQEAFAPVAISNRSKAFLKPDRRWRKNLPLPPLPSGEWFFHTIPFRISKGEPGRAAGGFLSLSDKNEMAGAEQTTLRVTGTAKAIYFLHGCAHARRQEVIGTYEVHYEDGTRLEIPIIPLGAPDTGPDKPPRESVGGVNIQDWYSDLPTASGPDLRPVILMDTDHNVGSIGHLYVFRWENPCPEKAVRSLKIRAERGGESLLMLWALTLAR